MHGLIVLDKPLGLTSRDAVTRIQGLLPRRTKIGHTGTLDPRASGILVLCLGQATRLTEQVQSREKIYRAGVRLGGRSTTDDAEGEIVLTPMAIPPTREMVLTTMKQFEGVIEQTPPNYSAAKIEGRRAYDLARRGHEVDLASRPVTIQRILVHHYDYPDLDIEVHCGKGTYIRALARDLGTRLGCGGYLDSLRRLRVGSFGLEEAVTLESSREEVLARVLPIARAVDHLPRWITDGPTLARFCHGQRLPLPADWSHPWAPELAVFGPDGSFVGVGKVNPRRIVSPSLVIPPPPDSPVNPG